MGNLPEKPTKNPPWYEPYIFTGLVLIGVIVFFTICYLIGRNSIAEHFVFAMLTISTVFELLRKKRTPTSIAWNIYHLAFFGLIATMYFSERNVVVGLGYSFQATVWFLALCVAISDRRQKKNESREFLTKLDGVVDQLRKATNKNP